MDEHQPLEQLEAVVLCGGSGTRLWPLSRKSFPKQFVPLIDGRSLLEQTLLRVRGLAGNVTAVASEAHRFLVADAMLAAGCEGTIILEPEPRNTAAAMALALANEPDDSRLLLFCPSDHHIPDAALFRESVRRAMPAARAGAIVTFGVMPSFPSTAYGYILQGPARADGSHRVERFVEKPSLERAQELLLGGGALWNAGIFLCSARTLRSAMREHAEDILEPCLAAMAGAQSEPAPMGGSTFLRPLAQAFGAARAESIDYAVLEKHSDIAVVPFGGQWSDVGSWNAVADLSAPDERGNRSVGQAFLSDCTDTYVQAPHRPVVALGTRNLLIIDTPDALLVAERGSAEKVRDAVKLLESKDCVEAVAHRLVSRPWGWYDSIEQADGFKVKRIGVRPHASLSLQWHRHRAEHWVVVKGVAEVTCGDRTFTLQQNESTYIPRGQMHRLHNPGEVELEIIEIQSGDYLGEDDIIRVEDRYGRAHGGA